MNQIRLTDIDELTLSVRDKTSQSHIIEAIAAYRGGANRASIISTWIAVTSDIISKIRELSSQGDQAAVTFINSLDNAIKSKDIPKLQKIENALLTEAKDKFEFLSSQEYLDLFNLQSDRNLCAHPAFVSDDSLFQPTPERVRAHIVHAIVYLLQHPPMQGKGALNRIRFDLAQLSFPIAQTDVNTFLNIKYLNYAKEALIKNLTVALIKTLLKKDDPSLQNKDKAIVQAMIAISVKHPEIYEVSLSSKLPEIATSLEDKELVNVFKLLRADDRVWAWVGDPIRLRIKELVNRLKPEQLIQYSVFSAMAVEEMKDSLLARFDSLSVSEQESVIAGDPQPEFSDKAVKLYCEARGFREAESLGTNVLLTMTGFFSSEQIVQIIEAARDNSQIKFANGSPKIIEDFFDLTKRHLINTTVDMAWKQFIESLPDKPSDSYYYPGLRSKLIENNVIAEEEIPF